MQPTFFNRLFHLTQSGRAMTPPRALMLSFAGLILAGSLTLMGPGMTTLPHGLGLVDALFTATSAVCVTGLVVVDTGTAFTWLGQAVILTLIQCGGLGIMTFSIFFLRLAGVKSRLRDELAVRSSLSVLPQQDVPLMVRSVVLYTLALEGVGAVSLFLFFLKDFSFIKALWLAVFHSVSAFCNAGFGLWSDSLTRYQTHWGINLTVTGLIVSGGLGFIVLHELAGWKIHGRRRLRFHTRLVLWTTLVLIALGTLVFLAFEWDNTLAHFSPGQKFLGALFQSVTTRTAGFNTIPFGHLANSTLLATMVLMFIGGSPGSTAGGIKTVTVALMIGMAVSRFRGFTRVNLFRRSVSNETMARAMTIILSGIGIILVALGLLLAFETGHTDHLQTRDAFISLLFEVVSAFGTVGLSMGVTGGLTLEGKLIIITTMFLGRVGPLTVALGMMRRTGSEKAYNYGVEDVMVG